MNEHVLRAIMQEQKHAYILVDRELRITETSTYVPGCCFSDDVDDDTTRYIGTDLLNLFPELFGYEDTLQEVLAGNLPRLSLEWVNRETATGETIYLNITDLPLRDAAGQIVGLVHLVEDITQWGEVVQRSVQRGNELSLLRAKLSERNELLQQSYQREQEKRRLSDTLREVAVIASSTLEQQKVLDLILTQLEQVVTYHYATVTFLDEDKLTFVAGRNKGGDMTERFTVLAAKYPFNLLALQNKKPVLISDVTRDARWQFRAETPDIRSFINAPLLVQDKPIGLLGIGSSDAEAYTEDDAQTVFAFASQVAISMYNAQLYAATQERNRRLTLLHEISTAVNSTLDLPTILTAACQKLVENFDAEHSGVLLFDGIHTYGEVAAEYPAQNAVGIHIPLEGYTASLEMIETAQPQAIYDAQHDARMAKVWDVMRSLGIKSILIVPLIIKDRVIGSFSLDITTAPRHFELPEIELCQTIAAQLAIAIDNARWVERERARIEQELETARQIQVSLLPYVAPKIPGLDITNTSIPARQVGGDFYNYFVFAEGVLGVTVGDVSGKGMEAALMMALSVGLLTTEIHREIAPAALLAGLNEEMRSHTRRNRMNTALIYIILEQLQGKWALYAANAGLISPLIRRTDGAVEWLDVAGLPLGMMGGVKYTELRQDLVAGDVVILSSDGVVEATNAAGEMYSFDRLTKCVATAPRGRAAEIQEWILKDLRGFVGDAEQHDDLTLIVIVID